MTDHGALLKAVTEDHPCDDSACDIAAMIRLELGQVAAWMLCSATGEHDAVNRVLFTKLDSIPVDLRDCDDWHEWKAFHDTHGVRCPACESFNYGDEDTRPGRCGNCLASLPAPADD